MLMILLLLIRSQKKCDSFFFLLSETSLGTFGGLLKDNTILLLCAVLVISVMAIGILIYIIKHNKCDCNGNITYVIYLSQLLSQILI